MGPIPQHRTRKLLKRTLLIRATCCFGKGKTGTPILPDWCSVLHLRIRPDLSVSIKERRVFEAPSNVQLSAKIYRNLRASGAMEYFLHSISIGLRNQILFFFLMFFGGILKPFDALFAPFVMIRTFADTNTGDRIRQIWALGGWPVKSNIVSGEANQKFFAAIFPKTFRQLSVFLRYGRHHVSCTSFALLGFLGLIKNYTSPTQSITGSPGNAHCTEILRAFPACGNHTK